MSKQTTQRGRHQKEATRTRLQTSIDQIKFQLDRTASKLKTIEKQILDTPNGVDQLKLFIKLNQHQNREKAFLKKLDALQFQLSCLESYRIPSRDSSDTFDEWGAVENEMKAQETRKALEMARQTRMDKENDLERDR